MSSPRMPPVPLDQPRYGATPGEAIGRFFRKFVAFRGRASRSEFWWAALFLNVVILVSLVPYFVATVGFAIASVDAASRVPSDPDADAAAFGWFLGLLVSLLPALVVSYGTVLGYYALVVRRLHDAGFSGWWALLGLAGAFGGGIALYVLCALPSRPEGLRFEPGAVQAYGYGQSGPVPYGQPPSGAQPHAPQAYAPQPYAPQS